MHLDRTRSSSNRKIYYGQHRVGGREREREREGRREGGKKANKKIPINRDESICRYARYRDTVARYRSALDDVKYVGNPEHATNQGYSRFDRKHGESNVKSDAGFDGGRTPFDEYLYGSVLERETRTDLK